MVFFFIFFVVFDKALIMETVLGDNIIGDIKSGHAIVHRYISGTPSKR